VYLQPLLRNRTQKASELGEITQATWPLRRSRSFKVTDFGTNGKPICDFLLVINSNLPYLYLAPYPGYEIICHIFASDSRVLHFNALAGGDPCEYRHK